MKNEQYYDEAYFSDLLQSEMIFCFPFAGVRPDDEFPEVQRILENVLAA